MIKLFVDMDDVVADWGFAFDVYAAVYDLRTGTEEERKETKRIIMEKHPTFYRDLELIPGALEMWKFFCTYTDPYILSAAATEMLEQSKKDKHYWLKKKFGKLCPPVERIYLVDHPILKQKFCVIGKNS